MALALVRELEGLKRELALFPDDASAWTTVPGITNSAANLALHLAGNLQYYVGGVLGGTGYVRNREAEFGRRSGTRAEITAEIVSAINVVHDVLPRLPQDRLDAPLGEPVMGLTFRTEAFLLHLCVHAGFHLGQVSYLRRVITADATSSGPIPLQPLAEQ
jgi:DinB superfamily